MDIDLILGIKTEAIKALCDSYDKEYGDYPEHEYEGAALLQYYFQIQKRKA